MKKTSLLGLLFLLLAALLSGFIYVTGNPAVYFTHTVLPGQFFYVLSKLCALLALFCLSLQSISGLWGASFYRQLNIQQTARFHKILGITTLILISSHIFLFMTGVSIRTEHLATHLLWFNFGDYYNAMLSIGLTAFLLILIGTSSRLFKKMPAAISLWLHRINLVAIALVFLHAYQIGTETRFLSAFIAILILGTAIIAALGQRIFNRPTAASRP